jgi:bla regulator protein BlaR1
MDKRIDLTNIPFVDDVNILGLWECVDFVEKAEDFVPDSKIWTDDFVFKQLEFLPRGAMLLSIIPWEMGSTSFTWTKDFILNKADETCSSYVIKTLGNSTYMFFEWKSGDYSYKGLDPYFYILKKIS